MIQILIVDDEKPICDLIQMSLTRAGYRCTCVYDGLAAADILERNVFDLILLDVMLPLMDGFDVCREVRRKSNVPIIMLTAREEESDKVFGLEIGADDYITKPFQPLELVARVRSNLRRYTALGGIVPQNVVVVGGLVIDDDRKRVTVDGEPVKLTPLEYNLLLFLAEHKGRVFSIAQLYEQVWKEPFDGAEKKVVVHISHLREKIEINPREPHYIKSVWGLGYKMEEQP